MANKIAIASIVLVGVLAVTYSVLQGVIAGGETSMLGEAWVIGMSVVVLGGVLVWLRMPEEAVKSATKATKSAPKKAVKRTSKKRK